MEYGITGVAWRWFRDYLKSRIHTVKPGKVESDPKTLTFGISQGSVIGPILFTLYFNLLCELNLGRKISYADDTIFIIADSTWKIVYSRINAGLTIMKTWLDSNSLTLNITKTKYIPFSIDKRGRPRKMPNIYIQDCDNNSLSCNCEPIESVKEIKYLE